jgi:GT2 family glycosyltransferase
VASVHLESGPVFSACAGACLYRLDAFRAVGVFGESYFMYVEDIDLGFRLQLADWPCLFVKEAVVRHIGSAITGVRSEFSLYHGHRNVVINYFKNMPMIFLVLLLPVHLLQTAAILAVSFMRREFRTLWKAKCDGYARLPAVLTHRQLPAGFNNLHIWRTLTKLSSG